MNSEERFYKWLQDNANLYQGNNASDCMLAAWKAAETSIKSDINKVLLEHMVRLTTSVANLVDELTDMRNDIKEAVQ